MVKPAPVPMQCAARRYKAILPPPGSRPRTKPFLLSNSIKLSNPRLTDLRLCPKANVLPSNRSLSEISFSELPSQGSIIRFRAPSCSCHVRQAAGTTMFQETLSRIPHDLGRFHPPQRLLSDGRQCRKRLHGLFSGDNIQRYAFYSSLIVCEWTNDHAGCPRSCLIILRRKRIA